MTDTMGGISKNKAPPTSIDSWRKYVKERTIGSGNNAVIMGRCTYEMMADDSGSTEPFSLEKRDNYVISKRYKQELFGNNGLIIFSTLLDCLSAISNYPHKKYDQVFVLGGARVFNDAVLNLITYCSQIVICRLHDSFECDVMFPINAIKHFDHRVEQNTTQYQIHIFNPNLTHQELSYIKLIQNTMESGHVVSRLDSTKYLWNKTLSFDLEHEFPIFTTRHVDYNKIFVQLENDLDNCCFTSDCLGLRLRSNEAFDPDKHEYQDNGKLYDLTSILEADGFCKFNLNPNNVNINVPEFMTFYITGKKHLHLSIVYSEIELFDNLPNQLVYFSTLMCSTAALLGVVPKTIQFFFTKCFIPAEYLEFSRRICTNDPKPFPKLNMRGISGIKTLLDFTKENWHINGYDAWIKLNIPKKTDL